MKKKAVSRLAAMLMTGAMMVTMFGMSVCAEEPVATSTPITSVPVTKTVTAEENVRAPYTSFQFRVVPGEPTKLDNGTVIYEGVQGGAYFASGADVIDFTNKGEVLTGETSISLDVTKFEIPGVYRYVVSEVAPTNQYDGITYSTKTYNLDVYVELEDGVNKITAVTLDGTAVATGKASSAAFENAYATNNLTVTKKITGNQADMDKEFEFTITINGAEGETYTLIQDGAKTTVTSGTSVKVSLGNEASVTVYGLSASDTYTIVEEDTSSDGYETTIAGADETEKLTASGKADTADDSVVYTNDKNVTTPTGILMSYAPYILMVVVAGAAVVLFLRRRNRAEF